MRRPGGWWGRKSTPAKVETYTRWSYHFFALFEFAMAGLPVAGRLGPAPTALLLVLVAAHSAVCAVTASRALDWLRGRRDQPLRLLWVLGALTAVVAVTVVAVCEHGPADEDTGSVAGGIFGIVLVFGIGNIALGVRSRRRVFASVVGFAAGAGLVSFPFGASGPTALAVAAMVLVGGGFLAFTSVFSVWLLNAVYELDEARETRTRLAVAEERLRFGRDLHDVMGRNLTVIALKSELAVQLAQRERPEAVAQMVEVQRLAHEAQREVREVVRGYREADLAGELAGAQGVLTAAGIDCTVTGPATGLPAPVQSALGWVVREAATNVLRHGDARCCAVELRIREGRVVLTVENDGVPQAEAPGRGSGLVGLRERLAEIGGTLRAGPTGDGLFLLTAEVPLPAHSGEAPPAAAPAAHTPLPLSEVTP
ncbi:sensor histidine kinase [Streptomyces viridosporus]|uniref:sensor histidine kinase n=1 Tax=Streptomyces viridosporus TaxID=67581 RepID=UPI0009BF5E3E|nr:sensor histidine kinase [Streptomyces viridosporus]